MQVRYKIVNTPVGANVFCCLIFSPSQLSNIKRIFCVAAKGDVIWESEEEIESKYNSAESPIELVPGAGSFIETP